MWAVGGSIGLSVPTDPSLDQGFDIAAMHGEQPLLRGLVDSGRKVLAGVLFMLPGILSDLIALVLLALPLNLGREFAARTVAAGHFGASGKAIDGEYHRVE